MHKCFKCGTEFEGAFCPECGTQWQEEKQCPNCGTTLAGSAKFCNDCGYSFTEEKRGNSIAPQPPASGKTKKFYAVVSYAPTILFALISVLLFFFYLAPVAVMPGGSFLGEAIPSESYGNVYQLINQHSEFQELSAEMIALIVFAAISGALSVILAIVCIPAKGRSIRVKVLKQNYLFRNVLTVIGYGFVFAIFLITCIVMGKIAREDGGMGVVAAGAAPQLALSFSLIFGVAAVGCVVAQILLTKKYSELKAKTDAPVFSGKVISAWAARHKKAVVGISVALVVVLALCISVPIGVINSHNGVYYLYNSANEELNQNFYYRLKGGKWTDNNGNQGKYKLLGNKITLYFEDESLKDLGGLFDDIAAAVEIKGVVQNGALTITYNSFEQVYVTKNHKHKYSKWKTTKEVTCTDDGERYHTCACKKTEIETIEALGHNFSLEHICRRCGTKTGHIYNDINECTICGIVYIDGVRYNPIFSSNKNHKVVGYEVIGFESDSSEIVIPDLCNGIPVISIGEDAFRGCESLTSITIPNSVTKIEERAFDACRSLTSITIPNSVISIGNSAFRDCDSLTSITIPNSVTSIGVAVFADCNSLTSITVDRDNPVYHGGGNCVIETVTGTLIFGCNGSVIPDDGSVTKIGKGAFIGCRLLASITIPSSVTKIEERAFEECRSLTSITIPNSVTLIGEWAFFDCWRLTSVTIPKSVTKIGAWAFQGERSSLEIIKFEGTKAQWKKISKGTGWKPNADNFTVQCTDGKLNKDGKEIS